MTKIVWWKKFQLEVIQNTGKFWTIFEVPPTIVTWLTFAIVKFHCCHHKILPPRPWRHIRTTLKICSYYSREQSICVIYKVIKLVFSPIFFTTIWMYTSDSLMCVWFLKIQFLGLLVVMIEVKNIYSKASSTREKKSRNFFSYKTCVFF